MESRALHWTNLPVISGKTPLGRLVVLQDVTHERQLQRMRDDLTHAMVHDLRNPLNIVSGTLTMLAEQLRGQEPDAQQLLTLATGSTARMLDLVNGILNISRLETGHMPVNRQPLEMTTLVREVLDAQRSLAAEKQIVLENGLPQTEAAVDADPGLIARVLQNLVGNAVKFTPPGGSIGVQVETIAESVRVTVNDSGPGVPPEIEKQLFNKFVRGEQRERGSGLGLAFCRMAVEAHQGEIWYEGRPGKGARFVFSLPVATSTPHDEPEELPAPMRHPA